MANAGDLCGAVSEALLMDVVTVGSYWRRLREADLTTKGGRGRSAPRVTPRDCARLLIAILGTLQVQNAAQAIAEVAKSGWDAEKSALAREEDGDPPLGLGAGQTLEEGVARALELLFEGGALELDLPSVELLVHVSDRCAEFRTNSRESHLYGWSVTWAEAMNPRGIRVSKAVSGQVLLELARVVCS